MPRRHSSPAGWITLLVTAVLVTGCARSGPPAPVDQRARDTASPNTVAPPAGGEVTVQPGESLYAIARRNQVPLKALIDTNSLNPPYTLRPGQRLTLPRLRVHEVQAGETVTTIARRYSVSVSELVRTNRIDPPHTIRTGQLLVLPQPADPQPAPAAPPAPGGAETRTAPAASPPPSQPIDRSDSPPPSLARPVIGTPTPSSQAPAPGAVQQLPLGLPLPTARPEPRGAEPSQGRGDPPPAPTENPASRSAEPEPPQAPVTEASTPQPRPAVGEPPPRSGRLFQWPLRGTVVSDFGPKPGGLQNDGVNIAAPRGTPIRAAENGVVVYAGNELRGFGNLLLIRHEGGWMTAYGHAEELLVKRGDRIRRGQIIAKVGSSGNVASPQLHFEIRRGTRAVNPREFLAAGDRA